MIRDKTCPLLVKSSQTCGIYQQISSGEAGWDLLCFMARTINPGEKWIGETGENEYLFVLLGGNFEARTNRGNWQTTNGRKDVFRSSCHVHYA